MAQKIRTILAILAFAILITAAVFAYDTLRNNVSPEVVLSDQPGTIVNSPTKSDTPAESSEPESESTEPVKALDFTVEDSDGNSVKLSDLEGKPVVLNFWASWCPPCKAEMPDFDKVYAELGNEVNFMMVNMTDGDRETKEKGAAYISENGFSFPIYYDITQEAAFIYGIRSIPTTLFINSNGYIVTGAEGQLDEKTLRYGIDLIQSDNTGDEKVIAE